MAAGSEQITAGKKNMIKNIRHGMENPTTTLTEAFGQFNSLAIFWSTGPRGGCCTTTCTKQL